MRRKLTTKIKYFWAQGIFLSLILNFVVCFLLPILSTINRFKVRTLNLLKKVKKDFLFSIVHFIHPPRPIHLPIKYIPDSPELEPLVSSRTYTLNVPTYISIFQAPMRLGPYLTENMYVCLSILILGCFLLRLRLCCEHSELLVCCFTITSLVVVSLTSNPLCVHLQIIFTEDLCYFKH